MNGVVEGMSDFCLVYQDDVNIFNSNFNDHSRHLLAVLDRLQNANITLKKDRCTFGAKEVKFLGHIVSCDGIKMNPEKVEVVSAFDPHKIENN